MTKVTAGANEILTYNVNPGSCFNIVELDYIYSNKPWVTYEGDLKTVKKNSSKKKMWPLKARTPVSENLVVNYLVNTEES